MLGKTNLFEWFNWKIPLLYIIWEIFEFRHSNRLNSLRAVIYWAKKLEFHAMESRKQKSKLVLPLHASTLVLADSVFRKNSFFWLIQFFRKNSGFGVFCFQDKLWFWMIQFLGKTLFFWLIQFLGIHPSTLHHPQSAICSITWFYKKGQLTVQPERESHFHEG